MSKEGLKEMGKIPIRFKVDEDIPKREVRLEDKLGKVFSRVVNIGSDTDVIKEQEDIIFGDTTTQENRIHPLIKQFLRQE